MFNFILGIVMFILAIFGLFASKYMGLVKKSFEYFHSHYSSSDLIFVPKTLVGFIKFFQVWMIILLIGAIITIVVSIPD